MTTETNQLKQEVDDDLDFNDEDSSAPPIIINEDDDKEEEEDIDGEEEEEEEEEEDDELNQKRNKVKLLILKNPELGEKLKLTIIKVDKLTGEQIDRLLPFIEYTLYNNSNTIFLDQLINVFNRIVSNLFKVDYEELNANTELRKTIINSPVVNSIFNIIPAMLFVPLRYGIKILELKFKNKNNNIPQDDHQQQPNNPTS
jgi:hypothetical protein